MLVNYFKIMLILVLVLYINLAQLLAQNLVTNPGFEKCDNCGRFGNSGVEFFFLNGANNPVDWFGVTDGSSDIRSTLAHSGKRHGGFFSFGKFEYLGNVLSQALEAGSEYQFSFWLGAEEASQYTLDEIGVFFHKGLPRYAGTSSLGKLIAPDLKTPDGVFLPSNNYKQFTFNYLACGGEDHIIIGRFNDLGKNDTMFIGSGKPTIVYPYTYVDDVELIKIHDAPDFLSDTLFLCKNESKKIGIPSGYAMVRWSNGSLGDSTIVKGTDEKIIIEVNLNKSCVWIRDTMIIIPAELPKIDVLPEKILLCKNEFAKIGIPPIYQEVFWSNGTKGDSTVIKPSDQVLTVSFLSSEFCDTLFDTILILRSELVEKKDNLIEIQSICLSSPLQIKLDAKDYHTFQWNTGSTEKFLSVKDTGIYIIKASNDCFYTLDTIQVLSTLLTNDILQVPNVITPGSMDNNRFLPIFKPEVLDSLISYDMEIFNRWGKSIFSTTRKEEPWIPSQDAPGETYFYNIICSIKNCGNAQSQIRKGAVNIIR